MEKVYSYVQIVRASFLVAGTAIGAGMLGIPLVTFQAGFLGAFFISTLVWAFMLITGLFVLEACLKMPKGASFFALSEYYLGAAGRKVTIFLFFFLYVFLIIAYLAAAGQIIRSFSEGFLQTNRSQLLALALLTTAIAVVVAKSPRFVEKVNFWLFLAMAVFWLSLVSIGVKYIGSDKLLTFDYKFLCLPIPILFSAFGYHNVIPSLTVLLKRDRRMLRAAIIGGSLLSLAVYLYWQYLIMGILGADELSRAFREGLVVTTLLQKATGSPLVFTISQGFAFCAIITSLLGVSLSLVDFVIDMTKKAKKISRAGASLLIFSLAFSCVLYDPAIFEKALSMAGGVGEAFLNGLIPVLLIWSLRFYKSPLNPLEAKKGKPLLLAVGCFAIFAFAVEAHHLVS